MQEFHWIFLAVLVRVILQIRILCIALQLIIKLMSIDDFVIIPLYYSHGAHCVINQITYEGI
jgi:hypothetical protein